MPTVTASSCVEDAVNRRRGDLVELSHSINAAPDLAFDGQATNVIPGRSVLRYTMRAGNSESLHELEDKIAGCFAAGSVGTGCTHTVTETAPAYAELAPDPWLSSVFREEM